jgi:hypothetical protein
MKVVETENMRPLKSDMLPVLKKLADEASQAKKLAELQALKNNRVEISVDQDSILDAMRMNHETSEKPEEMADLMALLNLLTSSNEVR